MNEVHTHKLKSFQSFLQSGWILQPYLDLRIVISIFITIVKTEQLIVFVNLTSNLSQENKTKIFLKKEHCSYTDRKERKIKISEINWAFLVGGSSVMKRENVVHSQVCHLTFCETSRPSGPSFYFAHSKGHNHSTEVTMLTSLPYVFMRKIIYHW